MSDRALGVVDVAAVTALAATIRDVGTRLPPPGEVTDEALAAALEALADAAGRLAVAARRALPAESAGVGAGTGAAVDPGLLPRRPRVVLVDDDETALAALAELLSDEFEIVACTDPLEGLRRAARPGADAVVTDLVMPGIDGLSLLRLLRANPATAEVPCLLLTASAQTNDKLEAFGLGAADYLMKPVDVIDLVARLRHSMAQARRIEEERHLQETDELTGLPNRRAMRRCLARALEETRTQHQPLTVALIDMDELKRINDTWGHAVGDLALRALADALRRCKRGDDCASRYGGDEFAVIMPGTDVPGAERLMRRVQEELERAPLDVPGERLVVHFSYGVARLSDDERDGESLFARADQALYSRKRRRSTGPPPLGGRS